MIAVGNDELGSTVKIGDTIINTKTDERITITKENYCTNEEGKLSNMILCYKKGETIYLFGIAGQLLSPWEKV